MLSEHPHEYMNESGWVNIVNNSVCNSRIEVEIDREKKTKRKNSKKRRREGPPILSPEGSVHGKNIATKNQADLSCSILFFKKHFVNFLSTHLLTSKDF